MRKLERLTDRTLLGRFALAFERFYHRFSDFYQKLLKWSLSEQTKVGVGATGLFILASCCFLPFGLIGNEFMPQTDRGEFGVTVELMPGSSVEQTNQVALQIEKILAQMPEIEKIFTGVGAQESGSLTLSSNNLVQFNVALVPKEHRKKSTQEVGEDIKAKVRQIPGAKVYVNPIGLFGSADQAAIQIAVNGTDVNLIAQAADQVKNVLRSIEGTTDVRLSSESGKPEMQISIDRAKMAQLGLSVADVGATLRVALTGDDESKYRDGVNEYDIRIQFDEYNRSRTESIGNMTFMNNRGQLIELKQFANVFMSSGPTKLERRDRIGMVYVYAQTLGRPTGTIVQDFKNKIAGVQLPPEVTLSYLGMEKMRGESFVDLFLALLTGILFVYLIMVALYDSYVYPFVVLFAIPLAIVGAMIALAVTGKSLSIFTMLGIIMLVGLVTKNAILLVDRTIQTRLERGLSVYDALLEAAQSRLRPILMTTFTMIFGMMPIALSTSSSSEFKSGLAWAIIGGLTSSLFLTLIVVPVVYMKVDEWKIRIPAFFEKPSSMFKRQRNGKLLRSHKAA